jgi:hypothetical protein
VLKATKKPTWWFDACFYSSSELFLVEYFSDRILPAAVCASMRESRLGIVGAPREILSGSSQLFRNLTVITLYPDGFAVAQLDDADVVWISRVRTNHYYVSRIEVRSSARRDIRKRHNHGNPPFLPGSERSFRL